MDLIRSIVGTSEIDGATAAGTVAAVVGDTDEVTFADADLASRAVKHNSEIAVSANDISAGSDTALTRTAPRGDHRRRLRATAVTDATEPANGQWQPAGRLITRLAEERPLLRPVAWHAIMTTSARLLVHWGTIRLLSARAIEHAIKRDQHQTAVETRPRRSCHLRFQQTGSCQPALHRLVTGGL